MKQKDYLTIGAVVLFSIIASLIISKLVFGDIKPADQQVENVQAITSVFPEPDKKYFNEKSIDPTKIITIGKDTNNNPFSGTDK